MVRTLAPRLYCKNLSGDPVALARTISAPAPHLPLAAHLNACSEFRIIWGRSPDNHFQRKWPHAAVRNNKNIGRNRRYSGRFVGLNSANWDSTMHRLMAQWIIKRTLRWPGVASSAWALLTATRSPLMQRLHHSESTSASCSSGVIPSKKNRTT